jgi:hypothetical protein
MGDGFLTRRAYNAHVLIQIKNLQVQLKIFIF